MKESASKIRGRVSHKNLDERRGNILCSKHRHMLDFVQLSGAL